MLSLPLAGEAADQYERGGVGEPAAGLGEVGTVHAGGERMDVGVLVLLDYIILFTGRNSATIVPKSAFATPAEAEAFAAFAKAQWAEARSVF